MKTTVIVQTETYNVTYELDGYARRKLKPIADEFDLSVEDFVIRFTYWNLPGQVAKNRKWSADRDLADRLAETIATSNPAAFKRIRRAALLTEKSPSDLIWKAIGSTVDCCEDDMLLSPKTGHPIADCLWFDLDRYVVSRVRSSEAA